MKPLVRPNVGRRMLASCAAAGFATAAAFGIAASMATPLVAQQVVQQVTQQVTQTPITVIDDNGTRVTLARPAQRILSLIPSATESLIALGLADRIVGRTIYDTATPIKHLPSVGGGLEPNLEVVLSLRPDLVISWAAAKRQSVEHQLEKAGVTVFSLATQDTSDILSGIARMAQLTGRDSIGHYLVASLRNDFARAKHTHQGKRHPKVLFIVSSDPPITAGPNAYVSQIIGVAGGVVLFPDLQQNWPTVSIEEIAKRNPDIIILPVGEFRDNAVSRLKTAPGWRDLPAVKAGRIIALDADLTNRPGPRVGYFSLVLADSIAAKRP